VPTPACFGTKVPTSGSLVTTNNYVSAPKSQPQEI